MSVKIFIPLLATLLASAATSHAQSGTKDFIDSPFVGQGVPPPEGVDIYMSVYLDRLLHLNQLEYYFHVCSLCFRDVTRHRDETFEFGKSIDGSIEHQTF